jgi:hypothetical protein
MNHKSMSIFKLIWVYLVMPMSVVELKLGESINSVILQSFILNWLITTIDFSAIFQVETETTITFTFLVEHFNQVFNFWFVI